HAISFAILAYGSAYLKVHRAPEFYASLLNNQPMGFYTPATIVKDAQRHGVKILPVCVMHSDWRCTVVADRRPSPQSSPCPGRGGREAPVRVADAVRLGFCVVNGLCQDHAEELVRQRQDQQFDSLDDFKRRVSLSKEELRTLAALGALNCFVAHRRAAMWRVEEQAPEALFAVAGIGDPGSSTSTLSPTGITDPGYNVPLARMTLPERMRADYETMNLTTGPHPMKLLRESLPNVWRAIDLTQAQHGATIQIAGNVICRQRPGTAKGF